MAIFDGHTVTVKGAKLLSRSLAGEGKFIFTKGAFGAGKYDGDVTTLEELIDKRLDLPLSDITYYEGAAVLNLQISNKTVEESFYTEELGLYAKLENDSEEVLFSYAKAVKPDAIPDNSLSVTFEGEYELYIKLTTNEKVGVQVNDNNVFITFKTGNREYVRTGCNIIGLLSVQTELIENGQYQAENGKWYLNVGGKRVWNRDGNPDEQLKEISFLQHEKDLNKKQYKEDSLLKTISKNIVGAINELFTNKLEKGGYSGTAQSLLTEISKIASKSILGRIIIGKGLSVDSLGRTSIVSKNDGITINESDIQLNTVDNVVTDSGTKPLSARQGKKLEENKQNKNDSTLLTVAKTIVGAINELFNNKLEKGGYSGNAKNLNDELSKKASKSILGRMIVGDNLTVDSNGRVSANPPVDISGKLDKGGLPTKISDAKGLYDLIESNSGLNFDTALLYLNDAGTKYVNKIYFDRNKKGLFKCISQTTSTTNSTSYFVDISNEANSAQLRNLKTNEVVLLFNGKISEGQIAKLSSSIKNFKFLHFFGISAAYSTPETLCVPSILLITQKEVSMSWRGDTTLSFQYLSNTEIKVSSSYSGYLYKIYGVN